MEWNPFTFCSVTHKIKKIEYETTDKKRFDDEKEEVKEWSKVDVKYDIWD